MVLTFAIHFFFIQPSGTSILDVYIQFAVFQQSDQEIKRWYKVGESQPKYFFFWPLTYNEHKIFFFFFQVTQ